MKEKEKKGSFIGSIIFLIIALNIFGGIFGSIMEGDMEGLFFIIPFLFVIGVVAVIVKTAQSWGSNLTANLNKIAGKDFQKEILQELGINNIQTQVFANSPNSIKNMIPANHKRREKLLADLDKIRSIKKKKQPDSHTMDFLAEHQDKSEHWYRAQLSHESPQKILTMTRYT